MSNTFSNFSKNRTILFSFIVLVNLLGVIQLSAQELHIASGGSMTVNAGDVLYVNDNLTVNASGSLTISSDSSSSASLLVTGTSTGNIIYERYIPDTDWYLLASPVASQDINTFTTDANNAVNTNASNYAVATYSNTNSSGNRWEYYTTSTLASSGNFISAKGYATNRTAAGYYTFEGTLATDDVSITLSTSSGSHTWSCVGNPYPSFIKGSDASENTSVLKENFSILDDSYKALYVWNGSTYEAINYASGAIYLASGQAFMVKANSSSESFTFSEAEQSHQFGATTFYRAASTPTIELLVNNGSAEKSTTLKYYENTTLGLDPGYDAAAFEDGTPIFSLNTHLVEGGQGLNFTVQCLPSNNYDQVIPVSVNAEAGSTLSFSSVYSDLPEDLHIYLEDVQTNLITDLKVEAYEVSLQEAIEGIGRFYLHTSALALNIATIEEVLPVKMYSSDKQTIVIEGLEESTNARFNLYNPLGQLVFSKEIMGSTVHQIILPAIPVGVYIVDLQTSKNIYSQKLFIYE